MCVCDTHNNHTHTNIYNAIPCTGRVPLLQAMAHDDMFLTDVCVRLQHYTCSRESFVYQRGERGGRGLRQPAACKRARRWGQQQHADSKSTVEASQLCTQQTHRSHSPRPPPGEVGGDVFILVRGELHVVESDGSTSLFRIPEGTVFGEATVLRHLEVGARAGRRGDALRRRSSPASASAGGALAGWRARHTPLAACTCCTRRDTKKSPPTNTRTAGLHARQAHRQCVVRDALHHAAHRPGGSRECWPSRGDARWLP